MNSTGSEIETLSGALAALAPTLDPQQPRRRFPVYRTKLTEQRGEIPRADRVFVYSRDNFRCVRCGKDDRLTLDHIIPWSAGGSDHVDNLRTLCWSCNEERSNFRGVDDEWRPLPLTFCCVDCETELEAKYDDHRATPTSHPGMNPCFCWFHRHSSIGIPSKWFDENNAFWDYDLWWHRDKYPGYSHRAWEEACSRLKFPILHEGKPTSEAVERALYVMESTAEWAESIRAQYYPEVANA